MRQFDDSISSDLMRGAFIRKFGKRERIFEAGEIPSHLGILASGMIELCGTTHDPDCGVLLLTRGDLLVPMATIYQETCLTAATALMDGEMIMLARDAVISTTGKYPEAALALAQVLGAQWRMAVRHIIDLKSRTASERLAAFLLRFADYAGEARSELPFTKKTLAARLGVSRETLSRTIQVVAENGIVLRGSEIVVRDRERAEAFIGPEPYVYRSERRLDVFAF